MLIQVCFLLLSVGIYASYADDAESVTDELFGQLDFVFPTDFPSRFPEEGEFFRLKIIAYLFFNIFAKYFGESEVENFWSNFNRNDFNRVVIDAAFYEYLTKFADGKMKHQIFNPLERSTSIPEDIAIDRIGHYLDNLSENEILADQSKTRSQATDTEDYRQHGATDTEESSQIPTFGIPGKDFPNYCDIPKTSFTCANKLIPGVYADMETGCQVFHVCWPHRTDSFLCPIGSTFNQALLTCDFWHESDCSTSPIHFDNSQFLKESTRINTDPTATMTETLTTSESPSAFTSEPDCPEYDGTCQSLISKPLQLRTKFLPAKCKVTNLKQSPSKESSKYGKQYNRLTADTLSRVFMTSFRDMLALITKATELGSIESARIKLAKQPKLKTKQSTLTSHSRFQRARAKYPSTPGETDTKTEEQIHSSTTKFPYDQQPPQLNSEFEEKPEFKADSPDAKKRIHAARRTLRKASKPSEESKKRAFAIMMETMELGSNILNDSVLPLMETIVLDSYRKKSTSKKV